MLGINILNSEDKKRIARAPLLVELAKDRRCKDLYEILARGYLEIATLEHPLIKSAILENPSGWLAERLLDRAMLPTGATENRNRLGEFIAERLQLDARNDPVMIRRFASGFDVGGGSIPDDQWHLYFETFAKLIVLDGKMEGT